MFHTLFFMFQILRISGKSMLPVYRSGDFVLIVKKKCFKKGDVIVFKNQLYGTLIKRIEKITESGIYVLGTGENSLDSRRLGLVNPASVLGKVIWHIRRGVAPSK